MFGLLLRSELLQGSAVRTWNCVLNIANYFRFKFNNLTQPVMPRTRRRHHSRSRSRSRSHSHDRDREAKRRRVESPERRSVSAEKEVVPKEDTTIEISDDEQPKEITSKKNSPKKESVKDNSGESSEEKDEETEDTVEDIMKKDKNDTSKDVTSKQSTPQKNDSSEKSDEESEETKEDETKEDNDDRSEDEKSKPSTPTNESSEENDEESEDTKEDETKENKEDDIQINKEGEAKEDKDDKSKDGTFKQNTPQKITPKKCPTPSQKKYHEKRTKLRQEREEQRRKEREEKEKLRRKEKEEKEEQRRKEKEEKEEQKRKEKEEKEEQRRKEKEEKEEQKRKEKEEKEEQRRKEKEEKELKKQQELDEKSKEKKTKEEKFQKEKAAFANFFRKSANFSELKKAEPEIEQSLAFMPFEVKSDMRLAPLCRNRLSSDQKQNIVDNLTKQVETVLYLDELKKGKQLGSSANTWPVLDDSDDVLILEDSDIGEKVEEEPQAKKMRAKLLKFHENRRPAYFGTWRKSSKHITSRKPLAIDKDFFDYEVDSDDDWEEEGPGESLHGSDDEEKDNEEKDDYEVDNEFFVPHGYLSDEEKEAEETTEVSPETQKEKLKILQEEFDEEMKSKTQKIKPRLIGCIWENKIIPKVQDAIHKFLEDRMMIVSGSILIQKREIVNANIELNGSKQNRKKSSKDFPKDLIPEFLQLIHGNTKNQSFLANEFSIYLSNKNLDKHISKASIVSNLKQLAKWKKCPDEGEMLNKHCWYVDEDVRAQYEVNLKLPNSWIYVSKEVVTTPKKTVKD